MKVCEGGILPEVKSGLFPPVLEVTVWSIIAGSSFVHTTVLLTPITTVTIWGENGLVRPGMLTGTVVAPWAGVPQNAWAVLELWLERIRDVEEVVEVAKGVVAVEVDEV